MLARPVRAYGYAYPFVELGLGVAYLAGLAPLATNLLTLAVMLIGLVGVGWLVRDRFQPVEAVDYRFAAQ